MMKKFIILLLIFLNGWYWLHLIQVQLNEGRDATAIVCAILTVAVVIMFKE